MSEEPGIVVDGVSHSFGPTTALQDLDLEVARGEVCGLVGRNGAGKTTLLRILATILRPTRGTVRVAGHCVRREADRVRRRIGYLPDGFGTWDDLRIDAYLEFFARIYRVQPSRVAGTIDDLLRLVDLERLRNAQISRVSLGARQRLGIARTLLHHPDVLLLDEPVSGLDPEARVAMRGLLRELGDMGKTVLISSHVLGDLADVCQRLLVLDRGRVVFHGTARELERHITGAPRILVRVDGDATRLELTLHELGATDVVTEETGTRFTPPDGLGDLSAVSTALFERGFRLRTFVESEVDLERAFLRLVGATGSD